MSDEAAATLAMVTLDCADPAGEAEFWAAALDGEVTYSDADYGMVSHGGGQRLGFGRVDGWQPPQWPNPAGTKQFHLDLAVDDLESAAERLTALGARRAEPQPTDAAGGWLVLQDPDGHLFCLTKAANWS